MNQGLLILLIIFINFHNVNSQIQKVYGFEGDDYGQKILKASDSTYFLFGAYSYLSQIDTSGNILWGKEIYQLDEWYFNITYDAIIVDSTNFIVIGTIIHKGGNGHKIFLASFDSNGKEIWIKGFGNPMNYCDASKIIQTKDNGFVIVGTGSLNDPRAGDLLVFRTDSTGDLLWSKSYGGENYDEGVSVIETENNNLIIMGNTNSFGNGAMDIYLINLNSTGDTIWTKTLGGKGNDNAKAITSLNQNEFVIIGTTSRYGIDNYYDDNVFVMRMNIDGEISWIKSYGGDALDVGRNIIKDKNNDLLIIGSTESFGFGQTDIYLLKINQAGDTIWTKVYGGSSADDGTYICEGYSGYYILGQTRSFSVGGKDMCLIQIDKDGNSACRYDNTSTEISDLIWKQHYGSHIYNGCGKESVEIKLKDVEIQINNMCDCIHPIAKFQTSPVDGWVNFEDMSTWADTWLWDFGDGETSNEQNPGHFVPDETNVCLTVQNQCGSDTYCEIVYGGAGIEENNQSALIELFPNPTKDFVFIKFEENKRISSINISDILGNEIMSIKNTNQNPLKINASMLSKGIYLIRFLIVDDISITKKIVIE